MHMGDRLTVALSGGVDSSVAALLAKGRGYEVEGVYMRTWHNDDQLHPLGECPWRRDSEDARQVTEVLGIPFSIINMIQFYKQYVVIPLVEGYKKGITPNPDVLCNQFIKFGILSEIAKKKGSNALATGHYCKRRKNADGTVDITAPRDKNKDQTYFLAYLNQEQIQFARFPLGNLTKPEVRQLAEKKGLATAKKKDSQGICFLGKVKIQDFLSQFIQETPGYIINTEGKIVGQHHGLYRFTIGQRHGLGIPSNSDGNFYVVIGKDLERNELHVAFERERRLYGRRYHVHNLSYTNKVWPERSHLLCRARYRDPYERIWIERTGDQEAVIEFECEQRALAPGQVIAFYDWDETLLGGGIYV